MKVSAGPTAYAPGQFPMGHDAKVQHRSETKGVGRGRTRVATGQILMRLRIETAAPMNFNSDNCWTKDELCCGERTSEAKLFERGISNGFPGSLRLRLDSRKCETISPEQALHTPNR